MEVVTHSLPSNKRLPNTVTREMGSYVKSIQTLPKRCDHDLAEVVWAVDNDITKSEQVFVIVTAAPT